MAQTKIPFTLIRKNVYYFNRRLNQGNLRISLGTTNRLTALRLVTQITSRKGFDTMDKERLEAVVRDVKTTYLRKLKMLLEIDDEENSHIFKRYQYAFLHSMFNDDFQSESDDISSQSYFEYKLSTLLPDESPSSVAHKKLSELHFTDIVDIDTYQIVDTIIDKYPSDFNFDYFKHQEEIERFLRRIYYIKRLISSGNMETAKVRCGEIETEFEKELTFSAAYEKYIEAGIEGDLPKPRVGVAKPWEEKVLTDHRKAKEIFCHFLGDRVMTEITWKDLDNLFTQVVSCLPKLNKKPYNRGRNPADITLALKHLDAGLIESDNLITNVGAYKEKLSSFYRYYAERLGGSARAVRDMKHEIPPSNTRGAFSDEQFRRIISFASTLNPYQKWAVWIMALTGMRNGEVQQLRQQDLAVNSKGIYFLKVRDEAGSVKTLNGIRNVPVHQYLLDKGIVDFFENSKTKEMFLCYSTNEKFLTNIYTNIIKPKLDLPNQTPEDYILSLYSVRHYVFNVLEREKVPDKDIEVMLGHATKVSQKTRGKYYLHPHVLEVQKKYIDLIQAD
ncbi:hypothetical protein EYS00_13245 [Alteromonas sp. KUL49]|nr:hypothetical protein EYS00_13245 [Alteromonas sp. KUL49]